MPSLESLTDCSSGAILLEEHINVRTQTASGQPTTQPLDPRDGIQVISLGRKRTHQAVFVGPKMIICKYS